MRGPKEGTTDRRAAKRFPIETHVRYRSLSRHRDGLAGIGTTLNMSSIGVLFEADKPILPGERVELALDWPVQLNDRCGLRLLLWGRVVRQAGLQAAIAIDRYDFHTRSLSDTEPRSLMVGRGRRSGGEQPP